jgi:hypothetical protein
MLGRAEADTHLDREDLVGHRHGTRITLRRRVLTTVASAIALLVWAAAPASAGPSSRGAGAPLSDRQNRDATAQAAAIPDACANLSNYPAFGGVCVNGSAWAPASLVAADTNLHLNVKSNGPTNAVVDGSNTFGLKWQCTEFAVRWANFAWGEGGNTSWVNAGWKTGAAQDMWTAAAKLPNPLQAIPNGTSQNPQAQAPAPGDLLIFHENLAGGSPGHVAVVLKVDRSTNQLTFIGENQWQAPAVVKVPITAANHVSTTGFSSGLHVSYWLHNPKWSWPVSTTLSPTGYLHPADPVCTTYGIDQGFTSIVLKGAFYKPGDVLSIHTGSYFLGNVTVSANGGWTFTFPIPSRPDKHYPVTVDDTSGQLALLRYLSEPYTCWEFQGSSWVWDSVGWDQYSPMTFSIDGVQLDSWTASANGAMLQRSFTYDCAPGQHSWLVSGMRDGIPPGGIGYAGGTFTC